MSRVTEPDLVLPALFIMSMRKDGTITTSELIDELEKLIRLSPEDKAILSGRNDSYFSQIVRNLKSHSTFERYGYAENITGGFRITDEGREFVIAKQDIMGYLFNAPRFTTEDVLNSCTNLLASESRRKVIPLTEFVQEGTMSKQYTIIRERSNRLRQAARDFYAAKKGGLLYCECCNFEFGHFYNPNIYSTCIEMHHLKPIYQYEDEDINKTIENALVNLIPVCLNCNRIIHKHHIGIKDIDRLKQNINIFNYN